MQFLEVAQKNKHKQAKNMEERRQLRTINEWNLIVKSISYSACMTSQGQYHAT